MGTSSFSLPTSLIFINILLSFNLHFHSCPTSDIQPLSHRLQEAFLDYDGLSFAKSTQHMSMNVVPSI